MQAVHRHWLPARCAGRALHTHNLLYGLPRCHVTRSWPVQPAIAAMASCRLRSCTAGRRPSRALVGSSMADTYPTDLPRSTSPSPFGSRHAGLKPWWLLTQVVRSRCAAYTCSRPSPDVAVLLDDGSGCSVVVLSCPAAAVDPKQVGVAQLLQLEISSCTATSAADDIRHNGLTASTPPSTALPSDGMHAATAVVSCWLCPQVCSTRSQEPHPTPAHTSNSGNSSH
jgi:hypothetical protein